MSTGNPVISYYFDITGNLKLKFDISHYSFDVISNPMSGASSRDRKNRGLKQHAPQRPKTNSFALISVSRSQESNPEEYSKKSTLFVKNAQCDGKRNGDLNL